MARLPRLMIAAQVHHVVQRGSNGQAVFNGAADYESMRQILAEQLQRHRVDLHAYVLMENHFHFLLTPQDDAGLSTFLQSIGRSYVRYFNNRHKRSGPLFDGRYRCTVLQAERYLLPCMALMDSNPVRSGLVATASDYAWSSHRHYIGMQVDRLVHPHALVWALGNTPFAREARYGEIVSGGCEPELLRALTESTRRGWALGDADFLAELQKSTERRLKPLPAGRPPKGQPAASA